MIRPIVAGAWLAATACTRDEDTIPSGIAVGNPPQMRVSVADGRGVTMETLTMPLAGVYLEDCAGTGQVIASEPGASLGLGRGSVDLQLGTFCVIGLIPGPDPVVLRGAAGEGTFRFSDALGRILLYSDGVTLVEEETFVLELAEPDWIEAEEFDLAPGDHLDLGGPGCLDDRLCNHVREGLMDRGGLYDDRDADGMVSDGEREEGSRAEGDDRRPERGG